MKCPKCKSENVTIEMVQVGSKTKKSGIGLGGRAHNAVRGVVGLGTLGLSNLVIKKATGEESAKTKLKKKCLCQNCGYDWNI